MLYIGDSLTEKFVLAAAFFFLRILCFPVEQTAKNPDTTPAPASWGIQKMQQYFPMNVNFMLNLSPNEKGKLDVGGALGIGVLSVIKDIGLKEPYVGQTILVTSEIAEDLTYYFATSEQTPSSVALGVLMNKDNTMHEAGGFIIQLMPDATEELIDKLEQRIKEITSVTEMLEQGMTPEEILNHILGDMNLEILDTVPTEFYCNCSKDRVSKAVMSIGAEELQKMIDDDKPIEVNCHFCNSHYNFTVEELKQMLEVVRR